MAAHQAFGDELGGFVDRASTRSATSTFSPAIYDQIAKISAFATAVIA
jgi:hypothetical protein